MGTLVTIADSKIDRLFTELSNLTKGTEITVSNFAIKEDSKAQICISTHG